MLNMLIQVPPFLDFYYTSENIGLIVFSFCLISYKLF